MYKVSICSIIKDERYLEEFIIYHQLIGVEHFYIYDNGSENGIKDRLNKFYYREICTIIEYPGKCMQIASYNDCINRYKEETEWLIIIDSDEYINIKMDKDIKEFLKKYEEYEGIIINWVIYGSNYYNNIQEGLLIEKYTRCENKQDKHYKSIVKIKEVIEIDNPHICKMRDGSKYIDVKYNKVTNIYNNNYTIDMIQINHYMMRSTEDRIEKYNRGNADSNNRIYLHENHHEMYNDIEDKSLRNKYKGKIERILYLIKNKVNIEMYKELNKDVKYDNIYLYKKHIYYNSVNENRDCYIKDKYQEFNKEIYRENYDDLKGLNNEEIEMHYIRYGVNENRICNKLIKDN